MAMTKAEIVERIYEKVEKDGFSKKDAAEVVESIREAGGVSSLAHAVWYKDPDGVVEELVERGLDAIEVFHPDHGESEVERFSKLARKFRLLSTAGSDYHGIEEKGKAPGSVTGGREMLDALERLREGRP